MQTYKLSIGILRQKEFNRFTWLSIHLKPAAAVHSFFEALLNQSRLYTLSNALMIVDMLVLLSLGEKISPLELMLTWLFKRVSNHPLPDLCIDTIEKKWTGVHAHSSLIRQWLVGHIKMDERKPREQIANAHACYEWLVMDSANTQILDVILKNSCKVAWLSQISKFWVCFAFLSALYIPSKYRCRILSQ